MKPSLDNFLNIIEEELNKGCNSTLQLSQISICLKIIEDRMANKNKSITDRCIELQNKIYGRPPVKHGMWYHDTDSIMTNDFRCSECGHRETSFKTVNSEKYITSSNKNGEYYYPPDKKFCSECGAIMDINFNGTYSITYEQAKKIVESWSTWKQESAKKIMQPYNNYSEEED